MTTYIVNKKNENSKSHLIFSLWQTLNNFEWREKNFLSIKQYIYLKYARLSEKNAQVTSMMKFVSYIPAVTTVVCQIYTNISYLPGEKVFIIFNWRFTRVQNWKYIFFQVVRKTNIFWPNRRVFVSNINNLTFNNQTFHFVHIAQCSSFLIIVSYWNNAFFLYIWIDRIQIKRSTV